MYYLIHFYSNHSRRFIATIKFPWRNEALCITLTYKFVVFYTDFFQMGENQFS